MECSTNTAYKITDIINLENPFQYGWHQIAIELRSRMGNIGGVLHLGLLIAGDIITNSMCE
jgi:hypothetical protein